jgi:FAD/FMN-containing dehydrogenase
MKLHLVLLALTRLAFALTAAAPAGCKKLSSDSDWPPAAEWKAAMPEIKPNRQGAGGRHPDYILRAENYQDVQAAVTFCAKHAIRLVIITSGHDFLGSSDRWSPNMCNKLRDP